eukprot:242679_1
MSQYQKYWPSLLDLLICGYVRNSRNTYEFYMNISTDIASIILKFHPHIPQPSQINTIFTAKRIKYYGKHRLAESKLNGIASIAWNNKTIITIDNNYCVGIHAWNSNKLSIEKKQNTINKILHKIKNKTRISHLNMSSKIKNKHLCFQITKNCSHIFAAGFEDNSFMIWDIQQSKSIQCIKKHKNIVSCLSIDNNILITGSYDKSIMIWKINHKHNTLSIQLPPTHVLDNQLAPVICVDISVSAGLIACCLLNGLIKIYNSRTIQQISAQNTYISNQHVYFTYSYFKPTILRISEAFGHIICHSQETETLFMLSSTGILVNKIDTNNDIYYDIKISKCGQYIICGGKEGTMRVKELPSFRTVKKFHHLTKKIKCVFLDKNEKYILTGLSDGHVMVSSIDQKQKQNDCKVMTLVELGF